MTYSALQGVASKISQETQVTGAHTSGGKYSANTVTHSHNEINLRVDNSPCLIKLKQTIHLEEGEAVTIIGKEKKGVFHGYAIRNDVTGVSYFGPWKSMTIFSLIMIIFSFSLAALVGLNLFTLIVSTVLAIPFAAFVLAVQKFRISGNILKNTPPRN